MQDAGDIIALNEAVAGLALNYTNGYLEDCHLRRENLSPNDCQTLEGWVQRDIETMLDFLRKEFAPKVYKLRYEKAHNELTDFCCGLRAWQTYNFPKSGWRRWLGLVANVWTGNKKKLSHYQDLLLGDYYNLVWSFEDDVARLLRPMIGLNARQMALLATVLVKEAMDPDL